MILTPKLTFGGRDSAFAGDSILTAALLDRVLHRSTIVSIDGKGFRIKDRRKAGVPAPKNAAGRSPMVVMSPISRSK
jgi:DNA replication protein DnaC